jgi:nucleoside-diphosphate-sugar epimerase
VKIGITGHDGFIGGSVFRALTEAGCSVVPLDDFTRSLAFEDSDKDRYPKALDWVLHFGAKTSIPESHEYPYETYAHNIGSTLHALRIAGHCHGAFLFMSSYVYGQPRYLPIDEKHPVTAVNPYMGSKIIGEEICRQICDMEGIPAVILRGFNIFGDHYSPGRLISDLLEAVRQGKAIHLNDPAPLRDYLYIKDFIALIKKIIAQMPVRTGTYNVGYGQSYSNREVAELVSRITNGKCALIIQSNPRLNDIPDCSVDTSLIKRTFSWQPEYPLQRALSELIMGIQRGRTSGTSN